MGIAVMTILLLALTALAAMAYQSQTPPRALGLDNDGMLRACPDKPNCLCSEAHTATAARNRIEPLGLLSGQAQQQAWKLLRQVVVETGGRIESEQGNYLHATYRSPLFRFVDDLEVRLDLTSGQIHLRSSSRVGHSDFDANIKRIEAIRRAYLAGLSQQ